MKTNGLKQFFKAPERVLVFGFLVMILLGTILLCLPAATQSGKPLTVFDSLFTATSAVCVTGLVAVDTATTFSAFGQVVLLILIQTGGLGFMFFATLLMGAFGRFTLRDRLLISESLNSSKQSDLLALARLIGRIVFITEATGALLLAFRFVPMHGWGKGIWFSAFHAISAFCNAGFDLNGNFSSLTAFRNDPYVLLVISALIICGGIGFMVIYEVGCLARKRRALSLQTKLVLTVSGVLLLMGMLFYALVEWNNPKTLAMDNPNAGLRLVNAFFQSVTMRTAGFNSVDLGGMTSASKLVSSVLMFIGASPASTGGGVKTTTIALLLLTVWSTIRGRNEIQVHGKTLPGALVKRAIAVVMIAFTTLIFCTTIIACVEQDTVPFIDLLFESASAIATVGVSACGTPALHRTSRALIIPMMFLGRVGPMTLALAFAGRLKRSENRVRYPEENVMIG